MATKAKVGNQAPRKVTKSGTKRPTKSPVATSRPRGGAAGGRGY